MAVTYHGFGVIPSPSHIALSVAKFAAVAAGVALGARLLYEYVFRAKYHDAPTFWDNKGEKFKRMRLKSFPRGWPRGWWVVVSLEELRKIRYVM